MVINLEFLKKILIFAVGFFLPWGGNFVEVGGHPPNYLIFSTLLLSVFLLSSGIYIPFEFKLLFALLFLNIAVTVMMFGGNYLFYENIQPRSLGPGAVYLTSDSNIKLIGKFFFLILFFIVLSSVIKRKREWFILAASFVIGLGFVCLLKLKFYISLFPELRFAGAYDDPNAFGISACVAFFLTILLFNSVKSLILKISLIGGLIFFTTMILFSQSRGALAALFFASFIFFKEKKLPVYKILFIGGGIFLVIFFLLKSLIPDRFINPETWIYDRGSGRLDIWSIYLSNIWKYFLTGVGFLRGKDVISTGIMGREAISHNIFLELFVESGVIGLFLFCFVLRKLWVRFKNFPQGQPYKSELKALFISWLIGAFFISSSMLRETWLVFALIVTAPVLYRDTKATQI